MAWKPEDAKNLRRQDQARGRRKPFDPDVEAEERIREKIATLLLQIKDEHRFREELGGVINDYGLRIGPEEMRQILQIWRQHHSR